MRKLLLWPLAILVLLILALVLFVSRPWSDYSPLTMLDLFEEGVREENFRHMETVFPYTTVSAPENAHSFPMEERSLTDEYQFDGETRAIADFSERTRTTGLLVIKEGVIVHEDYYRGAKESDRFTSWSVAKSFVATLVGMALEEGKIRDLDDPITDYVPQLENTGYQGVSIKHVLQMASGVDFDETYDEQFSDINLFFWKAYVFGRSTDNIMTDYGSAGPGGEVFHYISINTQALGMLLRNLYGQSVPALLEEKLWQPLGMEGDAYWNLDSDNGEGHAIAFCCLNAHLRDYARLGQLYLQQGEWQGEQLISADWVQEATTPEAPFLEPGASPYRYGGRGYQYQWWVPEDYEREYFAAGVWGQYIYVSEPDNLVIVRTAADPGYHRHTDETVAVFRALRDSLR